MPGSKYADYVKNTDIAHEILANLTGLSSRIITRQTTSETEAEVRPFFNNCDLTWPKCLDAEYIEISYVSYAIWFLLFLFKGHDWRWWNRSRDFWMLISLQDSMHRRWKTLDGKSLLVWKLKYWYQCRRHQLHHHWHLGSTALTVPFYNDFFRVNTPK